MANQGIGTHFMNQMMMRQISFTKNQFVKSSEQISSSQKTDSFAEMTQHLPSYLNTQDELDRLSAINDQLSVISTRLGTTAIVLGAITDRIAKTRQMVIQALSPGNEGGHIDVMAYNMKKDVAQSLNTEFGGIYLFGGTEIAKPPVLLDATTDNIASLQSGQYYKGNDISLDVRLSDSNVLSYGSRANEDWAKKFFTALKRIETLPQDIPNLRLALDELNQALTSVTGATATIGHQMATVDRRVEEIETMNFIYQREIIEMNSTDMATALGFKIEAETRLEASYMMLAAMSKMRLSDYLR